MTYPPSQPLSYASLPVGGYASPESRARWTVRFLISVMVMDVLLIPVEYVNMLHDKAVPDLHDPFTLIRLFATCSTALLRTGLFITTVVFFLMWLNRVSKNTRALGVPFLKFTSGWAVGWWFIPIMNLFRPYQVVKELYQANDPSRPQYLESNPIPSFVSLWWTFWIIDNFVSNISIRLSLLEQAPPALSFSISAISNILTLISGYFAILVVRNLTANQLQKYQQQPAPVTSYPQ